MDHLLTTINSHPISITSSTRKVSVTDAPAVAGEDGEDGDGVEEVVEEEDAEGMIEVDVHERRAQTCETWSIESRSKDHSTPIDSQVQEPLLSIMRTC